MAFPTNRRALVRAGVAVCAAGLMSAGPLRAQSPVSVPSSVSGETQASSANAVSEKQAHAADDAYIDGARQVARNDLIAAEKSFAQAAKLNPTKPEYFAALEDVREHRLTQLVQQAAQARLAGDFGKADDLMAQARAIDPDNPVVTQHAAPLSPFVSSIDPLRFPVADIASTLGGPVELKPAEGVHSFHERGDVTDLIRKVYSEYGLQVQLDESVRSGQPAALMLDDVDFATASRVIAKMAHIIAVPLQARDVLVLKDTQENRDRYLPQEEETVYLPGLSNDQMTELANVARNVFDLKTVTASATNGDILIRGDQGTLKLLNATYADLLDGGSDVVFDLRVYEIQTSKIRNIGAQLPSGAGVFSVTQVAQNLVSQNQSLINQLIASGALKLTGNYFKDLGLELAALVGSGAISVPQFTNLIAVFGSLGGIPLAGLYLNSSSSFNLMLNETDARLLDQVTVRGANGQALSFRAGTRYPVITGTYSSGGTSSLLSGLSPSLQALAKQYGVGSNSVSIPQFQFEDLGLTIKATPHLHGTQELSLALEMKIESLAGTALNNVPVLNSRSLTSTITVPIGQTAVLLSQVSRTELGSIAGIPGLSELPGFYGTDKDAERDNDELLISITPHIARTPGVHVASHPALTGPSHASQ